MRCLSIIRKFKDSSMKWCWQVTPAPNNRKVFPGSLDTKGQKEFLTKRQVAGTALMSGKKPTPVKEVTAPPSSTRMVIRFGGWIIGDINPRSAYPSLDLPWSKTTTRENGSGVVAHMYLRTSTGSTAIQFLESMTFMNSMGVSSSPTK